MKLGLIVEGHGDVAALPVLIRRIATDLGQPGTLEVLPPARVPKSRMLREQELGRYVELMARKVGEDGAVWIVCDADDDCPARLGPTLTAYARTRRPDRRLAAIIARREYESWLVAGISTAVISVAPRAAIIVPPDPESIRGAKEWLKAHLPHGYSETVDQPALSAQFDWREARRLPSFDKFLRELEQLLSAERRC